MPSLINNPGNVDNSLAQNYRRVRVGNSQFGTRQIQLYEIHIYGLSDAAVSALEDGRNIRLDGTDFIDQPAIYELDGGSVLEAVIRGVQVMAEIYMVGFPEWFNNDPDDNELTITVGVGADTVESFWEQVEGAQTANQNSNRLIDCIGDSVDQWCAEDGSSFSDLDVYPAFLTGSATDTWGPVALAKTDPANVAVKEARQAKNAAQRAANLAAGRVGYRKP